MMKIKIKIGSHALWVTTHHHLTQIWQNKNVFGRHIFCDFNNKPILSHHNNVIMSSFPTKLILILLILFSQWLCPNPPPSHLPYWQISLQLHHHPIICGHFYLQSSLHALVGHQKMVILFKQGQWEVQVGVQGGGQGALMWAVLAAKQSTTAVEGQQQLSEAGINSSQPLLQQE